MSIQTIRENAYSAMVAHDNWCAAAITECQSLYRDEHGYWPRQNLALAWGLATGLLSEADIAQYKQTYYGQLVLGRP